jgi:actin cytoskeleton-regulatory complex protein PAN1
MNGAVKIVSLFEVVGRSKVKSVIRDITPTACVCAPRRLRSPLTFTLTVIMAQWGQGQPGFQYPQQTGFPGQQQGFPQQGFQQPLQAQPTGFPPRPPSGFGGGIQPQPTGFPGGQGFQQPLQAQPTGFPGGAFQQQQRRAPPPVPPIPSQFAQQNRSGFGGGLAPQPTGFPGMGGGLQPQPTGFPGGGGLQPQPTGFPGGGLGGGLGPPAAPLVPQMTGFIDPRLQMISSSFMPTNLANPYAGGSLQLPSMQQAGGLSLQQSFQQMNQETRGTAAPRVPWQLSKGEKKSYDQIFRAWDSANTGFIDGKTALEVFGQSGIDRNDLAKIW